MSSPDLPRILVVDDEEAILETMTYTFLDVYEVLTSSDAQRALEIMDERAPIAVVITDQRMPGMPGVELLKAVYERHPDTVRIMLTGFADTEATIKAINDGHVYAYIKKPWEPEELKQLVRRAVEHYELSVENRRLLEDLRNTNSIMSAVMDRLGVGAIAVDRSGIVRASNEPARRYLGLEDEGKGIPVEKLLAERGLSEMAAAVMRLADEQGGGFEDHDLATGHRGRRVRVSTQQLVDDRGELIGRVVFFKEISHEPLRRRFEAIIADVSRTGDGARGRFVHALEALAALADEVRNSEIESPSMSELAEKISRSRTAIQNWLDVDEAMAREEYPDAQLLLDRMRVARQRWPRREELPAPVEALAKRVESYYESGENSRERVL